ncbi:MAG: choice-of-anchor D domain-containing protein [Candidatus Acidiferrales bacterium]
MIRRFVSLCILALAGITMVLSAFHIARKTARAFPSFALRSPGIHGISKMAANADGMLARANLTLPSSTENRCMHGEKCVAPRSIPMTFEPNIGQFGGHFDPRVEFVGRGAGMTLLLTRDGMDVEMADRSPRRSRARIDVVQLRVGWAGAERDSAARGRARKIERREAANDDAGFAWRGEGELRTVSNYFIGRDPRAWHTDVPHFERAVATSDSAGRIGVVVYGNQNGVEYDLRLPVGSDASRLRLRFSGTTGAEISGGELILFAGDRKLRMARPNIYDELAGGTRKAVRGKYVMEADGSVGLDLGPHDPRATLVVDPSISVAYATFLGGAGSETAGNVAVDASGNVYVAGATTASSTFPETTATGVGPVVGASAFYVAKIDPTVTGANSLVYLTFLGGSGTQSGGLIAVDGTGDVAITGTTTSTDFPVTGLSQPTSGLTSGDGNDVVVSEINAAGNQLNFSAYFGGSGRESGEGPGGIALDQAGDVYIASDVETSAVDPSSPDLPVTVGAFQPDWDGDTSDGFLAVFAPPSQPATPPTVKYCTYLGTNSVGQVGVGGVAVDSSGNAYVAGSASNASSGFPIHNAFQSQYGGGSSDGFVMKIAPMGQGASDLIYGTLIGGSGMDEITSIALDSSIAPKAYVTGETQSPDFPVNGASAPYQSSLLADPAESGSANAFLAVIGQDPVSAETSLSYSTYLGGSLTDSGLSTAVEGPSAVYVAGQTDSPNFSWHDNLQPFNGGSDAFLAMFDPTASGAASLIFSTPLGGTSQPSETASAAATGVAVVGGQVYVTGETTGADFPTAVTTAGTANGFQQSCVSCQAASPSSDAFLVAISESTAPGPSVYFNLGREILPPTSIGSQVVGAPIAVLNGGEQTLTISAIQIVGPNASDFSPQIGDCVGAAISPGPGAQCSLELTFTPSLGGPETAYVSVWDNAPGSPQLLEVTGTGEAPHALIAPPNLDFGSQPINAPQKSVQTITITNSGTGSLTLTSESGPSTAAFGLQGGTCEFGTLAGASIAGGSSCTLDVFFAPTISGPLQDQIQIWDNSDSQSGAEQIIALTGKGVPPAPVAQVQPLSIAFGTVPVGTTGSPQSVVLTNEGSASLSVNSITIQGANSADFTIDSGVTTCPVGGGTVAVSAGCIVAIQFAPQSAGTSKSATLSFSDNAAGNSQIVTLTGAANNPAVLQVSPSSLIFAAQGEGSTSAAQTITITNTGSSAASVSGILVKGSSASDFSEQNACSPVLSAGGHCQVSISFDPATDVPTGPRSATLDVPGGTPASVALSGIATQAAISFTAEVNFASQLVGTEGAPQPITITNSSSGPYAGALALAQIGVSGSNKTDFSITGNTCSGPGSSVSPGNSCTVQVAFQPQEAATCGDDPNRSATIQLEDNAPGSPQLIPLTGAAADFCLAAANGQPVTAPVEAGEAASFNLEIASSGGFTGTVELSCVAEAGADLGTCSTSPESVQATPGAVADFTVTVPTYAATSILPLFPLGRPPLRGGKVAAAVCAWAICLLLVVGVGGVFADNASRRAFCLIQMAALVLAFSIGIAACGSGGNADPSPSSPGTPPGIYSVTVTATAASGGSSTSRTASLTFTVE